MFNPLAFRNSNIAGAESAGLAVNTNIFSGPNLPCSFIAFLNSEATLPSTTLLNSEKSWFQPCSNKSAPSLANSSAVRFLTTPLGDVDITLDLLVANVSSKSNIVIPLDSFWLDLDCWTAVFIVCLSFILSGLKLAPFSAKIKDFGSTFCSFKSNNGISHLPNVLMFKYLLISLIVNKLNFPSISFKAQPACILAW